MQDLRRLKGIALIDVVKEIHPYIDRIDFPTETKIQLLDMLAEIECVDPTLENFSVCCRPCAARSAYTLPRDQVPPVSGSHRENAAWRLSWRVPGDALSFCSALLKAVHLLLSSHPFPSLALFCF